MDYQLYENSDILLNDNSNTSKNSWSMESNGDFFAWNGLKIDHEDVKVAVRKRKLSEDEDDVKKQGAMFDKRQKDPLSMDNEKKHAGMIEEGDGKKSANFQKVTPAKMPHWQVEDYEEINTDIESSLTLGEDLVNHNYNVSETILSINGITMFKQEAPSPTSNEVHRQHRQSPTSSTPNNNNMAPQSTTDNDNNSQTMLNNTISQLLSSSALANLHNVMDCNNMSPTVSQDNYVVSSTNYNLIEDCRFQYVLAAATSIATKQNEDTLTYLNQGQSYEIKLKKLGDLSLYKGKLLKSVIRICFHERRLQYMEKEQMMSWQKARPGDRILEVDVPLSYGAYDIEQPPNALNLIHFSWDPTKEVGVYIKVNCISTEFTPKKHGGEKGVPFRIQVETYQPEAGENPKGCKRLHAAACQIKVFKLKGADRKHKQDREKIMKRPLSEQEKYQPSYECTVLNDLPNDAVLAPPPMSPTTNNNIEINPQLQNPVVTRTETCYNSPSNIQEVQKVLPENYTDKKLVTSTNDGQLTQHSSPEETGQWLAKNRFNKYLMIFEKFSGDDLLRMTRDDLIQICGNADGIRLHNAIHSKTIAPKLKIYVCQDSSPVYNAIFLTSYSTGELLQKLCCLAGLSQNQVRDIYFEGPQLIHVQLTDDYLRHVNEESMYSLKVIQQGNSFVFLLKGVVK